MSIVQWHRYSALDTYMPHIVRVSFPHLFPNFHYLLASFFPASIVRNSYYQYIHIVIYTYRDWYVDISQVPDQGILYIYWNYTSGWFRTHYKIQGSICFGVYDIDLYA